MFIYMHRDIFNKVAWTLFLGQQTAAELGFGSDPTVQILSIWHANEAGSIKMSSLPHRCASSLKRQPEST